MLDFVLDFADEAIRFIDHMDRRQWMIVFAVAVAVGAFCMRGFGSRANY